MRRDELITRLAETAGTTKRDADALLNALRDIVICEIPMGNEVRITGLGTFTCRHRAPRRGVSPVTGEPIQIPGMQVPVFSASASLKRAVREPGTAAPRPRRANDPDEAERRRLYGLGLTDDAIGEKLHYAPGTIAGWRRRHGLPANRKKPGRRIAKSNS